MSLSPRLPDGSAHETTASPLSRSALATALDRAAVPEIVLALRRAFSPWLTVLAYQRVLAPGSPVLDDGVVGVTPDQLQRQLAFVARWFEPVGIDDLLAFVRGQRALPKNPLLVTFDGGYRDNHDVALPILLRLGLRATFFAATDCIARRRLFWWDRVALVVRRCGSPRIEIDYPIRRTISLDGARARRAAVRRLQRVVNESAGLRLPRFLDGLERAAGVSLSPDEEWRLANRTVMSWQHVFALRRAGMGVQSHTCTHRALQTLDDAELTHELRASRAALEAVLGETVRAVAYAVGGSARRSPRIARAVRDAGYALGFSDGTGVNRVHGFEPFDVRRLPMEDAPGDPLFRAMLALPALAR